MSVLPVICGYELIFVFVCIFQHPESAPKWLTGGGYTLLFKLGEEGVAKNYGPTTSLPTSYKLATLLIMNMLYNHIVNHNIIPAK
eukprot:7375290-Ditylum_brightwellii.AAC.1